MDYSFYVTYLYESMALVAFVLISLIFVKPPQWLVRWGKSFVVFLDRWI